MRWLVLVMLCVSATAQESVEPPSRDIAKLLQSKEPSDLAWGAHLAAEGGRKQYVPAILTLLERPLRTDEDRKLPPYIMDALLRLGGEAPEKLLEPLAKDYPYAVLNLARKEPQKYFGLLMRMLEGAKVDLRFYLIGVLSEHPTPVFTSWALRNWSIEPRITVTDPTGPDTLEMISIGPSNFSACFPRTGNFPPIAYRALCSDGSYPVTSEFDYFRKVAPDVSAPWSKHMYYEGPDQVRTEAAAFQALGAQFIERLRAVLIERGLLQADDPSRPRVLYKVYDLRQDKSVPLPDIGGLLP